MTTEQIEFHRKKFEEWFLINQGFSIIKDESGSYAFLRARSYWNAWISAIESIEIEIPDQLDSSSAIGIYATHECLGHNNCLAEVKHNIKSLGLKVKER